MQNTVQLSLVMLISAITVAHAQDVGDVPMGEIGDPQAGFEYAHATCAACHAISEEKSPNPKAPRFKDVANTPGMTPTAEREPPNDAKYHDQGAGASQRDGLYPQPEGLTPPVKPCSGTCRCLAKLYSRPRMDVKEADKEIIIEAELPGIEEGHFAHPPERVF